MQQNPSYVGLRLDILKYVEKKSQNVLDVGCASGANGEYLKKNGLAKYVEGVEFDKGLADEAKLKIDKTIIGDLDDVNTLNEISKIKFDTIILGDILEHTKNPEKILKKLSFEFLHEDGIIIISLPNFQHIDVLIHIFFKGYFPRNERGLFDKTHLRFFTLKNIKELIHNSNLKIDRIENKFRYRDKIGSSFPIFTRTILTRLFKKSYTFQYLLVCSKK